MTSAAFIPACSIEEVQQLIDRKEARLAAYLKNCDVVWLVIVHGLALSSTFSHWADVLSYPFRTKFDRVFLFDLFEASSRELTLQRSE